MSSIAISSSGRVASRAAWRRFALVGVGTVVAAGVIVGMLTTLERPDAP